MEIKELLSGIAIIIDDEIKNKESGDLICKICDNLRNNHIPILEYDKIPDEEEIKNFKNISFILLDWLLYEPIFGIQRDEKLFIKHNIEFLKKIKEIAFIPVFIFSNQERGLIIDELSMAVLYNKGYNNNYIFVRQKSVFLSGDDNLVFTEIANWLKKTPSMYLLKKWECSLNQAKSDLFWSFYEINPNWPSVLQKTFTDDGSDVNYELGNFIYKNLSARAEQITFDNNILDQEDDNIPKEDIRKVLEAERFIKNDSLPGKPCTGDLFECEVTENGLKKQGYYLNIRPECDITRDNNPELYCLKCLILNEKRINSGKTDSVLFINGTFIEKANNAYISFIDDGKILEVFFKNVKIFKWEDKLKDKNDKETGKIFNKTRIGRLLPPYITKVQQRYSSYLQRQGLPAIPEKAIYD